MLGLPAARAVPIAVSSFLVVFGSVWWLLVLWNGSLPQVLICCVCVFFTCMFLLLACIVGSGSSSSEPFGSSGVLVVLGPCYGFLWIVVGVVALSVRCSVAELFFAWDWFSWTRGGGCFSFLSFLAAVCGEVCFSLVGVGGFGVDV